MLHFAVWRLAAPAHFLTQMVRVAVATICVLGCALASATAGTNPTADALRDDLGHPLFAGTLSPTTSAPTKVTAPTRIVSLLPSLTETVCALGACDHLVGVDSYSNYPASVQELPRLGGGLNPDIERIVKLRPDLVLLASSSPAVTRLQALGLRVLVWEPQNYADVQRAVRQLALVLGSDAAPEVLRQMESGLQQVKSILGPKSRALRVYIEVNRAPYAASESSFMGELLERLGVRNIVPATLGAFPRLSPEFVVRANPDLIMVSDSDPQRMTERPGWKNIAAVKANRMCIFTPAQNDILVRPGPRLVDAARLMADCINRYAP